MKKVHQNKKKISSIINIFIQFSLYIFPSLVFIIILDTDLA